MKLWAGPQTRLLSCSISQGGEARVGSITALPVLGPAGSLELAQARACCIPRLMLRVELPCGEHASLQRERHSPPLTALIEGRVNPLATAAHTPYPAIQDTIHVTPARCRSARMASPQLRTRLRKPYDEIDSLMNGVRAHPFFSPGSRLLSNAGSTHDSAD